MKMKIEIERYLDISWKKIAADGTVLAELMECVQMYLNYG